MKRIVSLADGSFRLTIKDRQLNIACDDNTSHQIPCEDIGSLVLETGKTILSQPVLTACLDHDICVLVCDARHLPQGLLLNLDNHHRQGALLQKQISLSTARRGTLWAKLVRAKILQQAAALDDAGLPKQGLTDLAERVQPGDPENLEAQAAQRYWRIMLGKQFRRDADAGDTNAQLNYGYAVLRATCARAICIAGLMPLIGLHHHRAGDAFPLAADVMEPYRPQVDRVVRQLMLQGHDGGITPQSRQALLAIYSNPIRLPGKTYPLALAIQQTAFSLAALLEGRGRNLLLPDEAAFAPAA